LLLREGEKQPCYDSMLLGPAQEFDFPSKKPLSGQSGERGGAGGTDPVMWIVAEGTDPIL